MEIDTEHKNTRHNINMQLNMHNNATQRNESKLKKMLHSKYTK